MFAKRGTPHAIKADNVSELISKAMAHGRTSGVAIDFSRPGKRTDKARCESFNKRFRPEYLNSHWFLSFADAKEKIDAWRPYYNEVET
ncbi:hypothetical protein BAU07_13340 [Bordetella flabilis]|uniref:Integrase catalytic domain-containing protein n=1 Tax=Bordetella flabilis TaxID=463014 RepID=A0A193GD40_9BORD|nr:hypothetical protein BAU07_13340 [Bordetella flabilis]